MPNLTAARLREAKKRLLDANKGRNISRDEIPADLKVAMDRADALAKVVAEEIDNA